jgi:lipid II:glycine glycyltransferase (peptidoglycan interpeptide bridge formation enzyme)
MMTILSFQNINSAEWSRLVQSSSTGTWFQTPETYSFYESLPDLFKSFVVAVKSDELRAVCVGYVTVEKSAVKQMLTRRAIIVGGPALADDATDVEVEALMRAVRDELKGKAIYVECRNFNDYSKWKTAFAKAGFNYLPHLNFHVDTSSVEVVEANLGKSRKRDIRTSLRDGATIIEKPTFEQVREYYAILEHLYKTRVKTPLFPLSFFEKLWQHKDGRFILVALNNEIIGGTVCVEQEGKCLYEWFVSGRDGEWKSIFPSSLATYAGIKYAAEHGCARFDMMGAGKPDEAYGVRDFKARFGGKEVEHGRFLCITKPLLYKIGVLGVTILKNLK